jgi:hypothetical protein
VWVKGRIQKGGQKKGGHILKSKENGGTRKESKILTNYA